MPTRIRFLENSNEDDCIIQSPILQRQVLEYKSSWVTVDGVLMLQLVSRNMYRNRSGLEHGTGFVKSYDELWSKRPQWPDWVLMHRIEHEV